MKHVMYGEKSHFLGDDAAEALMAYARALGNARESDSVTLDAVDLHGNAVEATFLLNASTVLSFESSSSEMVEPENGVAVESLRTQVRLLDHPVEILAEDRPPYTFEVEGQLS